MYMYACEQYSRSGHGRIASNATAAYLTCWNACRNGQQLRHHGCADRSMQQQHGGCLLDALPSSRPELALMRYCS